MKIEIKFTPETDAEAARFTEVTVEMTAGTVYAGPRRTSPGLFLLEADLRPALPQWSIPGMTALSCEDDAAAEEFAASYAATFHWAEEMPDRAS